MTRRLLLFIAVLATALVGGLVGAAFASHQFPDVSTSSPFHGAIDNFVDAGCATGFPDGTYRPTDSVNRQQMARFVNACAGRVSITESGSSAVGLNSTSSTDLTSTTVTAGALRGGGILQIMATVELSSLTDTAFQCEALFFISVSGAAGGLTGGNEALQMDLFNTADPIEDNQGTLIDGVNLNAGQTATVTVRGSVQSGGSNPACAAPLLAEANLSVLYVPFAGDGDAGIESVSSESDTPEEEAG